MVFYLAIVLVEAALWWRLRRDFRERMPKAWPWIRWFNMIITLILIYGFLRVIFIKGDMALPQNAYAHIFFGAAVALVMTAGSVYVLFSLLHRGLELIIRREFRGFRWFYSVISLFIVLLFFYGYTYGRLHIKTERKDITVACPDKRLEGLKIAMISDLHLSSFRNHYGKLEDVVSEINSNRPDIMINTGDFVTYGWQEFDGCDTILRKVRVTLGSFAVAGNHDDCSYDRSIDLGARSDGALLVDSLIRSSGYVLLSDTAGTVIYKGARVTVAGIKTTGHRLKISYGDENEALAGASDSTLVIFLVHDPAFWDKNPDISEAADLTLSGHTHGMQLGIPLPGGYWSPASLVHKYWAGLYESDGHYLYVNRGLGTMAMAIRIFMPPEITIITLHCR